MPSGMAGLSFLHGSSSLLEVEPEAERHRLSDGGGNGFSLADTFRSAHHHGQRSQHSQRGTCELSSLTWLGLWPSQLTFGASASGVLCVLDAVSESLPPVPMVQPLGWERKGDYEDFTICLFGYPVRPPGFCFTYSVTSISPLGCPLFSGEDAE
ncbi:hypothetical protein CCHR01_00168 [Colletotrichum chrysophilum]|uniref:Uncharacterized protein n=1 Tax=Colletotrichum chrysophilum TaxID=1836956 RepID=A0AAD9B1N2_9PEZI|nr:hypothetical protein CCHR01_00168 [Colletotrichum chrysophilum]